MYIKYRVEPAYAGKSVEFVLHNRLKFSNKLCKRVRTNQAVQKNSVPCYNKAIVQAGDILEINYQEENELVGKVENPAGFEILYEDEWYVVVNKPPLLPTHPRFPGDAALTTAISSYNLRAANRLDHGTSGLVILAKNSYAHDLISRTAISKIYLGMIHGRQFPEDGSISAPIGREEQTIIFRQVTAAGKPCKTHYRTLAYWPKHEASLLAFLLETGRTHQIRVHMRYTGHPMLGDQFYGWEQTFRYAKEIHEQKLGYYLQDDHRDFTDPSLARDFKALALNRELNRQFLHAYILKFKHPLTGEVLTLKAKLPDDLEDLLDKLQREEYQEIQHTKIADLLAIETKARVE